MFAIFFLVQRFSFELNPYPNPDENNSSVSNVFQAHLQKIRQGDENQPSRKRHKELDIVPGRSVGGLKNDEPSTSGQTLPAREKDQPAEEAEYPSDSSDSDTNMNQINDQTVLDAFSV